MKNDKTELFETMPVGKALLNQRLDDFPAFSRVRKFCGQLHGFHFIPGF